MAKDDSVKTLIQNYREDLQRHEEMDMQAFQRLEDKIERIRDDVAEELAKQREDFGYVFLALKVIGAVSVAAWVAVKAWFAFVANRGQ